MLTDKPLTVVKSREGQPLYLAVRDTIRAAVESGRFRPGERLPSTKELALQLSVSLVTAHRAMQELVTAGVLERTQGRGTFVHERFSERKVAAATTRIGLICHDPSVMDIYYRCMVLEGIRQATQQLGADLLILGYPDDIRSECTGLVLVDPPPDRIAAAVDRAGRRPLLSIGTHTANGLVSCIEIDNLEMGRRAVNHLCDLGHRQLGFMGGDDNVPFGKDRWHGFLSACQQREVAPRDSNVIRSLGSRLDERERMALIRTLSSPHRPTAVFAAGYEFAMDVLETARTVGLVVPRDLSIVAVDDPPSAPYLDPSLTTFRQPLLELGHAAVNTLVERIHQPDGPAQHHTLRAELIVRGSTGIAIG